MTRFAVTGHMDITPASAELVRDALRKLLAPHAAEKLVGISCIARGSDTVFAEVIVEVGGQLLVVLPSRNYREAKVKPDHAPAFDRLIGAAAEVVVMEHESANRTAYEAANRELLRRADRLVAVWDGSPPAGNGGTADTVAEARAVGLPVDVIWPEGARRGS